MLLTSSKAKCVHLYLFQLLQWLASLLSLNCLPATLFPLVWRLSGRMFLSCHPRAVPCFHTRILHWKIPQYLLLPGEGWCLGEVAPPGNPCAKPGAVVPASHLALNTKETKSRNASPFRGDGKWYLKWMASDFKGKTWRWCLPLIGYYICYTLDSLWTK